MKLANEKISERDNHHQLTSTNSSNTLQRPTVDVASQRTSLPDISLTPRERDILEQTSAKTIRASHSTESILRDSSPPPKPPLPNRSSNPPPLPPKRKSQKISQNDSDYGIDTSLLGCGLDRYDPSHLTSQHSKFSHLLSRFQQNVLKIKITG